MYVCKMPQKRRINQRPNKAVKNEKVVVKTPKPPKKELSKLDKLLNKTNFLKLREDFYDLDLLKAEVKAAEEYHHFLQKVVCGWESIPLRSVAGREGNEGNKGGGKNNSGNPNDYLDTTVMKHCPYIRSILDSFEAPILKVRIMKLIPDKKIHRHVDLFADDNIVRLHIPIETNKKVIFEVNNEEKKLPENSLWLLNVRKLHKVDNKGKSARIHIVFDVMRNEKFDEFLLNKFTNN